AALPTGAPARSAQPPGGGWGRAVPTARAQPVPSAMPLLGGGAVEARRAGCMARGAEPPGGRNAAWQPSGPRGQSGGDAVSAAALTSPRAAAQTGIPLSEVVHSAWGKHAARAAERLRPVQLWGNAWWRSRRQEVGGKHGGHTRARKERIMQEARERRAALPAHPLPAGLAAPDTWQLRVDALAAQAHTADGVCDADGVVPEQHWAGVAVAAVLTRAGGQPAARFLKGYAGDYTVLLPLEEALAGGARLARSLNGQPLTPAHGAPLRLVAPGRVCWERVQWVDRLEVLADETATPGANLARARLQR
ncbi:MAG: molybdopterin-dependent oxidoreductase, partial [Candidatus Tectimicrobiota bacterium]